MIEMKVISGISRMQAWTEKAHREGKRIGFVPTMGCLHEGHLSLMRKSRAENDYSVISIFVNPTQFGPKEDFKKYPRTFSRDKKLAKACGVDVIFRPRAKDMYPDGEVSTVDVGRLGDVLCGASRPGHFRGVATVVLKLFNIVRPHTAYFGQKDAQQAFIVGKMVEHFNLPVRIKALPIVREKGGVAMSSRNSYLTAGQRQDAEILYNSLQAAVGMIKSGDRQPRKIVARMRKIIKSKRSARIEYVKIVDANNLKEVKKIKSPVLIAVAVFFGRTRLIDNVIV
jgi:pantoate--beta-alanine ligase